MASGKKPGPRNPGTFPENKKTPFHPRGIVWRRGSKTAEPILPNQGSAKSAKPSTSWQAAPAQDPNLQTAQAAKNSLIIRFIIVLIILVILAVTYSIVFPPLNPYETTTVDGGGNYCYSNAQCDAFGNAHCGGTDTGSVECGSDNLCHCAYGYTGCTSVNGCSSDPNLYCDPSYGVCYFNNGGSP